MHAPKFLSAMAWTGILAAASIGMGDEAERTLPEHTPGTKAGDERSDNGLKIGFLWCPAGQFTMGSPADEPGRESTEDPVPVEISQGFWLAKFEVTQGEWEQVMSTTPWKSDTRTKVGPQYAATYISHRDAVKFCEKFSQSERDAGRLGSQEVYALPSEAQWEYACRAGTTTAYTFGNDAAMLENFGWFSANAFAAGERYAHLVGQKKANPWGFYDLHGNVFEWCQDRYTKKLPGGRDPLAAGTDHVIRGGGWFFPATACRSAARRRGQTRHRNDALGFRLAICRVNERGRLVATGRQGKTAGEERADNELKMRLLWCPPGKFTMGSPPTEENRYDEEHQANVELSRGFWLGKYEVTQREWELVMPDKPWVGHEDGKVGPNYPANFVSYEMALQFSRKLTASEQAAGRITGREIYTLPTEAQWEYACRAGTTTPYHYGSDPEMLPEYAWFAKVVNDLGEGYAHEVGQKRANPWGFHDQGGNVWEWCLDAFSEHVPGGRDPLVRWAGNGVVVIRGGSYDFNERDARSAKRNFDPPDFQASPVGFRLALTVSDEDDEE